MLPGRTPVGRAPVGRAKDTTPIASYYVTTFAAPTSNGNQTITVPFDPTAMKVTMSRATSLDTASADNSLCVGFSDGTNQYAAGVYDRDNVSVSVNERYHSASHVVYVGTSGSANVICDAVGAGLGPGTEEWVVDWVDAPGSAYQVTFEFWDCPAHVGWVSLGTGTSAIDCATTGVDPNVVMMAQGGLNSDPSTPGNLSTYIASYGIATNRHSGSGAIVERGMCMAHVNAISDSTINTIGNNDATLGQNYNNVDQWQASVTALTTDKFQITPSASASSARVGWLALDIQGSRAVITTETLPTTTASDWDVTGVGFTPGHVSLYGVSIESADLNTIQTASPETDSIFIGVTDGWRGGGVWGATLDDFDKGGGELAESVNGAPSGMMMYTDYGGTTQYNIPVPTYDSDGFSVRPDTAVASPTRVAFMFAMEATTYEVAAAATNPPRLALMGVGI